ncbi:MAG: LptA/OstA family protein [Reyranellaceae bacterium]
MRAAAFALMVALLPGTVAAQAADRAIEVTADQGLEWDKTRKLYIARGNARLTRGRTSIAAGVLRAWYRDDGTMRGQVYRVEAETDVRITRGDLVATGAHGTYDTDKHLGRLTGAGLAASSGDARLTATDAIEMYEDRRVVVARGGVRLMRPGEDLRATTLTLHFEPVETGRRGRTQLARVEAQGDVRVVSCAGTVQADRIIYDPQSGDAQLSGNVKLTRGNDRLEGAEAEINTKDGSMRVTSAPRGRVAVVLKKNDGAPRGAPCR